MHTNSLSHAHGSAVVRTGDTAVVCGVRAEILSLKYGDGKSQGRVTVLRSNEDEELMNDEEDGGEGELRSRNLIVTNLELGTGCSRDYHPGPPSDFAQTTTSRLHRLILSSTSSLISPSSLRIIHDDEIKAYWVLYIDVLCISLDGNVLDTAWASIIAALRSTRLPRAFWDADSESVLCDPEMKLGLQLGPLCFTASFGVVSTGAEEDGEEQDGSKVVILSDPDEFEESVCEEAVMICIREGGTIARIEKGGGLLCGMEGLGECVRRARSRYEIWEKVVRDAV